MIRKTLKFSRLFNSTAFNFSEAHNEIVTNFIKLAAQKFNDPNYDAKKQRPRDSFVQEFLYFKSKPEIYLAYSDWTKKGVRIGKILEDLDILAGMIGFNHAVTPKNKDNIQLVTASLDRIEMIRDIPSDSDIRMSGQVNFVGRSSMEITIIVDTVPDGFKTDGRNNGYDASFVETKGDLILSAEFTMVALDKNTMKSMELEQLRLETNQDKDLFEKYARKKAAKLISQRFSLRNAPPTVEEMYSVHEVHLEAQKLTGNLPNNLVWMHDTEQKSISLTHNSERNINNKIFGGYLMRLAFEQAYATALLTTRSNVRFKSLEDITFKFPVPISSILSLKSRAVLSEAKNLQVEVVADVINFRTGESQRSNEFYFTFECETECPKIMPKSYAECVCYIEGKRRYLKFNDSKK